MNVLQGVGPEGQMILVVIVFLLVVIMAIKIIKQHRKIKTQK